MATVGWSDLELGMIREEPPDDVVRICRAARDAPWRLKEQARILHASSGEDESLGADGDGLPPVRHCLDGRHGISGRPGSELAHRCTDEHLDVLRQEQVVAVTSGEDIARSVLGKSRVDPWERPRRTVTGLARPVCRVVVKCGSIPAAAVRGHGRGEVRLIKRPPAPVALMGEARGRLPLAAATAHTGGRPSGIVR